jgi:hypothetical protein
MLSLEKMTPEMRKALITCYRIAAARGQQLRLAQMQAHEADLKAQANESDADDTCSENNASTMQKGDFENLEAHTCGSPHAEEEGTVYNPDSRSPSPHEPMDHHH